MALINCPTRFHLSYEKHKGKLFDIGFGYDFLDLIPKVKTLKEKLSKWEFIELKFL